MTSKTLKRQDSLEKMLRYMLGTAPDEFGLHPDDAGFVPLKVLVAAINEEDGWRGVRAGQILMLANQPGETSPLEIAEDLIRLKPALADLPPEAPDESALPKMLYTAFKPAAWAVLSRRGLRPKTGDEVVRLWSEAELALRVGRRFSGAAVLVTVRAARARQAGAVFRPYSHRLWLTTEVPAEFLSGPPVPEEEPAPRAPEPFVIPQAGTMPMLHRGKVKGRHDDAPDWKNQLRRERRRGGRDD
jgi:putative RNA 2'-phosphotransferase